MSVAGCEDIEVRLAELQERAEALALAAGAVAIAGVLASVWALMGG